MANPISDEEWSRTLESLEKHKWNQAAAATELGLSPSTVKSRVLSARARKLIPDGPILEGYRVKGTSTLYDAEGNISATWVKTAIEGPTAEEAGALVRQALEGFQPPAGFSEAHGEVEAELATVYPLADWHVGLLSWRKETGFDYDLKIGQKTIEGSISRLIASTPKSAQGVVLGLGDLLHSDNYESMTSRSSNVLDCDGRYPKLLYTATQLVLYTIELALQKHDTVLVRILPGNHDDQSAIAVTLAVSLYYQNNPRVTVDDDAGRFWWWSWGKVFLGATHGDKAKPAEIPLIMADERPDLWGKAKFRHVLTGHIHRDTKLEKRGVIVESFQSPVASDAWHASMGYRAGRSVQAITYHKDQGEIMRHKVNIV